MSSQNTGLGPQRNTKMVWKIFWLHENWQEPGKPWFVQTEKGFSKEVKRDKGNIHCGSSLNRWLVQQRPGKESSIFHINKWGNWGKRAQSLRVLTGSPSRLSGAKPVSVPFAQQMEGVQLCFIPGHHTGQALVSSDGSKLFRIPDDAGQTPVGMLDLAFQEVRMLRLPGKIWPRGPLSINFIVKKILSWVSPSCQHTHYPNNLFSL